MSEVNLSILVLLGSLVTMLPTPRLGVVSQGCYLRYAPALKLPF